MCYPELIGAFFAIQTDQDTTMPFPWAKGLQSTSTPRTVKLVPVGGDADGKRPGVHRFMGATDQPWFEDLGHPCQSLGCIDFQAPKLGITAGRVLKHASRVLETIFAKNDPCIFKVGLTHNPAWRWSNDIFGYQKARDGWTNMTVVYVSREPHSVAMLEASLIDKYVRILAVHCPLHLCLCAFIF